MTRTILLISFTLALSIGLYGQKGIDKQTDKIRDAGSTSQSSGESSNSYSWGKDKTRIRKMLPNPYPMTSRRDVLIDIVVSLLKDRKMIVDEAASRFDDGLIITQPFTFSKGAILTKSELNRYATLPGYETIWTRGRLSLIVEIQSLDGIKNSVSVTAKVEGRSGNGLFSEWATLQSTGIAEDEFLAALVQNVVGDLPEGERRP